MIISEKCFNVIVNEGNYTDIECLKFAISKGIGYGMIIFSSILKLPQIIKIINAKSVVGLSPISFYLEVIAYTLTIVYNYVLVFLFIYVELSIFIIW